MEIPLNGKVSRISCASHRNFCDKLFAFPVVDESRILGVIVAAENSATNAHQLGLLLFDHAKVMRAISITGIITYFVLSRCIETASSRKRCLLGDTKETDLTFDENSDEEDTLLSSNQLLFGFY